MPKAANNISTTKCILFANIGQKTAVKCTHEYMKEKLPQKQIKERKKDQNLYIKVLLTWKILLELWSSFCRRNEISHLSSLDTEQIQIFSEFYDKNLSLSQVSILTQLVFEL